MMHVCLSFRYPHQRGAVAATATSPVPRSSPLFADEACARALTELVRQIPSNFSERENFRSVGVWFVRERVKSAPYTQNGTSVRGSVTRSRSPLSLDRSSPVAKMPLSIGVNLRVTGHCNQGGRKYMEDMFCVAFQPTSDDKDLEYAFFGIFDGHGGGEAALFAKEHLMDSIVKQKNFWSDRDEDVLRAIRDGYVNTHYAMWRELDKWPRTASGLPSTAGTTASIVFIRKGKIYIGHVGDSAIILGYQIEGDPQWKAKPLTKDHKPESGPEMARIQESGGKVVSKSGVPRVVWNRPRIGHKGPVRRSTHMDEIPFLAVARSLGDLWSYNSELNTFVVSPEPDVKAIPIDVKSHRCLILGTDGLWNMMSPQAAVAIVQATDRHNEKHLIASQQTGNGVDLQMWINPSKSLVDRALERWSSTRLRADNTSVVTLMLDPSGPSRTEVLLNQKKDRVIHHGTHTPTTTSSTVSENVNSTLSEEVNSRVSTPYAPIPLLSPSTSPSTLLPPPPPPPPPPLPPQISPLLTSSLSSNLDVEPKQPDSSNHEDIVDQVAQLETSLCSENLNLSEEENISSEPRDIATDNSTESAETNDVGKSIQVDEISSSQMPEETGDIENKKVDEIVLDKLKDLASEKKQVTEQNKDERAESDNAQNVISELTPELDKLTSELEKTIPDLEKFTEPEIADKTKSADKTKASNVAQENAFSDTSEETSQPVPIVNRLRRSHVISIKRNSFDLNESRHKRPLFPAPERGDLRSMERRHSLNTSNETQNGYSDVASCSNSKTYVNVKSRYKKLKSIAKSATSEELTNASSNPNCSVSNKRRHSAMTQAFSEAGNDCAQQQEPCAKRRTRSEDRRRSPTDENDPANQVTENTNGRLSWSTSDGRPDSTLSTATTTTLSGQDKLSSSTNTFQRRNLGKKVTPVKAIRRSSMNGSNRLQQLRGSFSKRDWDQGRNNRMNNCNDRRTLNRTRDIVAIIGPTDTTLPQRWLRSDTMAATPVKTLRSRNVDIAGHTISAQLVHHYGVVKQNRLPLPNKLKQSANSGSLQSSRVRSSSLSSNKLKQTNSNGGSVSTCAAINPAATSSASGIAKRVKSPYNPSARSLSTRSRIKRLGK
ncbi:uncharacterized protein LOC109854281 isoform X2 [Pseudomyrmex gracilis]|uniref:uncharacterized protein LOC109854281 isoform X2 n=1 Tax=Pseudomyrmex gracilis TaxID=219809 RepID=UPI000994C027|nr:uncharacterized protein LOC109854281 isoform X2 [Pseudomyrmex gracilis]